MQPVWISQIAEPLEGGGGGALSGLSFAVKDNIDVAGVATTAGCPGFAYVPSESAVVVERLNGAGAVVLGKTNMDQFATGLVGTRSPYGACHCVFDERYISGGSSSGSAVAVALGLVDFALGTDTAGSGRVPAAFNNIIGLKPTRGLLSTRGVVPACCSLDCVSIFARTLDMARRVFDVARGFDAADPYSREGALATTPIRRVGVLAPAQREFLGDDAAAALYEAALQHFEPRTEIDFTPLQKAAQLLYAGPWVAERLAAIHPFFEQHAAEMDPVVREVIGSATRYSAADAFNAQYELANLKRHVEHMWQMVDALVLPTAPTIYSLSDVAAEPFRLNTNLGYYTNFVNLLDMSALAVPAGFRANGLPFGISLIGPAFADHVLLGLAERYLTPAGT